MADRLIAWGVLAAVLSAPVAAGAQIDPMRPPPGLSGAARAADVAPSGEAGSAVQSVILRKGMKPLALVGGETVTIGSSIGDAKVVAISESEVILNGPAGRQVLKLSPDVDKKVRQPSPAALPAPRKTMP